MRKPLLVVAALGSGAAALAGVVVHATTEAEAGGRPVDGEVGLFRVINDLPDALELVLWPPMQLGSRAGPVVAALLSAALLRRVGPPVALLVAGFGAHTVAEEVKNRVGRLRPAALLAEVNVRDSTTVDSFGFPSSHVATATALAFVGVALLPRRSWRVAVGMLAVAVAVGRVFVGAHLPLDALAGGGIGLAAGAAVRIFAEDRAGFRP